MQESVTEELRVAREQMRTVVGLLMKMVPILDLQVSEHNDGYRLRRDIVMLLAGLGYPGWERDR